MLPRLPLFDFQNSEKVDSGKMSSVFIAFMDIKFIFRSPYSAIFANIIFEKVFLLHLEL